MMIITHSLLVSCGYLNRKISSNSHLVPFRNSLFQGFGQWGAGAKKEWKKGEGFGEERASPDLPLSCARLVPLSLASTNREP